MSNTLIFHTITSSALVVLIVLVRMIFRKRNSARLISALWILVALKLSLPFPIYSVKMSAAQNTENLSSDAEYLAQYSHFPLLFIYLAVAISIAAIFAISAISFAISVKSDRKLLHKIGSIRIFATSKVTIPCVFGFRAIYVGSTKQSFNALRHEIAHIRRLDFLRSIFRCAFCALYWYNPLVWIAARLSKQDAELACDEFATRRFDKSGKIDYARELLEASTDRKCSPVIGFLSNRGTNELKDRLNMLLRKQKSGMLSSIACAIFAVSIISASFIGCEIVQAPNDTETISTIRDANNEAIRIVDAMSEQFSSSVEQNHVIRQKIENEKSIISALKAQIEELQSRISALEHLTEEGD